MERGAQTEVSAQAIVADAERTAAEVAALADSLAEHAGNVKREADQLVATLREAAAKLSGTEADAAAGRAGPINAPAPSDGAQVLVAQLVVGGSSREEMERRLREEFGIEDASGMLDAVLGPEHGTD